MHTYEAADKTVANKGNGHSTIRKYTKKEAYKLALYDLSKTYFSHHADAAKTQKRYLREGGLMFSGEYKQPRDFWERLSQVNEYINYFPWTTDARGAQARPFPLCDDELIEILDKARTMEIRKLMLNMGDNARKYASPDEYAKKLQEWYENVELTRTLEKHNTKRLPVPTGRESQMVEMTGLPQKSTKMENPEKRMEKTDPLIAKNLVSTVGETMSPLIVHVGHWTKTRISALHFTKRNKKRKSSKKKLFCESFRKLQTNQG